MNSSKRRDTKPAPKKKPTKPPPQDQNLAGVDTSEVERMSSGMVPEQWNQAVRLQAALRDALDRPVSLVFALEAMRDVIKIGCLDHVGREMLQKRYDEQQEIEHTRKEMERREISRRAR